MTDTRRNVRVSRDGVAFVAGLLGVVHETLVSAHERPFLLAVFCMMMGLPVILNLDEWRQGRGGR